MSRAFSSLCVLSTFIAACGLRAQDDWPQLQHDAGRTGYTAHSVTFDKKMSGGPRVFETAWKWEKPAEVSPLVQPVVSGGRCYVGDCDGILHAIDADSGKTLWTFKTGGIIYHTAAVAAGFVYTGSQDGTLYAIDTKSGRLGWKYATGRGIVSAPCVLEGRVFVTSKDGHLYALDAARGALLWQYPQAGEPALAPILCSPAAGGGVVTFGDESLTAYALDVQTGRLQWKAGLRGQSFMSFWPVVGEKTGIVVYRTQPVYSFHENLNRLDPWFEKRTGWSREQRYKLRDADKQWAQRHRKDVKDEQDALREYLREHPWEQTCYVLELASGKEKYIPSVPYTGGGGYAPAPPVLDDANARGWMVFRTGYAMADGGYLVRGYTDVGEWDPASGYIRQFTKLKQGWETWHLVGDETVLLSANRDLLFLNTWPNHGAIGLENHDSYNIAWDPKAQTGHARDKLWAWNAGSAAGNGGGHGESTVVTAEGKIFWNSARYICANRPMSRGSK